MNRVPKLRFKEFSGEWEEKKLETIIKKYEDPIETPTEGYMRLGLRSHAKGTFHSYVEKGKELETAKMFRVAPNKFILNITFAWEHAVAITSEEDSGMLVSHRFPQFSFDETIFPLFFGYLILDKKFKNHLELSSPGGAGRNRVLKIKEMLEYKMKFPSKKEQEKIITFLSSVDRKISITEEKLDLFKEYKKGILQKIFKQELRFKDNKGNDYPKWEEKRLGDLGKFYRGHSYNSNNVIENGLLVLRSNNIQENKIVYNDLQFVNKPCKKEILLKDKDIIICMANGSKKLVGKTGEYKQNNFYKEITIGAFCSIFRTDYNIAKFLFQTKKYYDKISLMLEGTNINNLKNSSLEEIIFNIPTSLEEQQKIADFLSSIDKKIDKLAAELEDLKEFKKGLLQQMFV